MKTKNAGTVIATILYMIIGLLAGVIIALTADENYYMFFAGFLLFIAAALLQLILHELGHLIFGLITGYKFMTFAFFGLIIVKESGKIKIKKQKVSGISGQCLMAPPEYNNGNFPVVLYNFGGVIINLLLSAVSLTLVLTLSITPIIKMILSLFFLIGFAYAFLNGIPLTIGLIANDGKNALSLSRNIPAKRALWLQLKISEQTVLGARLKDMPDEWFLMPCETDMMNQLIAALAVFRSNRLLDMQCFDEAKALSVELINGDNKVLDLHKNLLKIDLMFLEMIGERREDVINGYKTKQVEGIMKAMPNFPSIIRTQYAAALFGGNVDLGNEKLRLFEKAAQSHPFKSDIESERELIEIARERLSNVNI